MAGDLGGFTVTLFNRGKTNPHLFPDVDELRGDRRSDLKALEGRSWDAVVDTSGYFPKDVAASAGLLAKSVGRYVFVSTISVYGDTSKPGIDESSPVETARDTLAWWKTLPEERRGRPKAGLTPEREAAVLAAVREKKAKG